MIIAETTVSALRVAKLIAKQAVVARLAACVHMAEIVSVYEWKAEMKEDKEYHLIFKTTRARLAALEKRVRELHTDELPEWTWHDASASKEYEAWVESVCR